MTESNCSFRGYYDRTWNDPLVGPYQLTNYTNTEHLKPASKDDEDHCEKRRVVERFKERFLAGALPGAGHVIDYLQDKYRRNLATGTILQSGATLICFLSFFQKSGKCYLEEIVRNDIAVYVEHEQDRGLKIASVRNKLTALYAFLRFLVDNQILPPDILYKKINIKLPKLLPKAIPAEDTRKLLAVIDNKRDRVMILLLLRTGMRIGELLNVKVTDIILPERKILLYLGEKNYQGRVVYYGDDAEKALKEWLAVRNHEKEYLFYGLTRKSLCHVRAGIIMRTYLEKAGLLHKGYSLHSLRHTFATNMLNAGLRLEVLQQLLGHLCVEITLRYAKLSNSTREKEYFTAMKNIEQGANHEHNRVNPQLQAVFKEKKLLRSYNKKLSA
ncbi:MAG: tyrosine-type recombinase/integrase [Bacteroidetes bacterium]|nr:tyrosine-type recombinase/integrase [Bacteroidota bacterium]